METTGGNLQGEIRNMSNLWIRDTSSVPQGGWRYPVVATEYLVKRPNYNALYPAIVQHCETNSAEVPSEEEVTQWLCDNLLIPCYEDKQPYANGFTSDRPGQWQERPVKRKEWPVWAKTVALLKTDADAGIGDTIERTIGHHRSIAFKLWFRGIFGKSCGCSARKAKWNKSFPYSEVE